ncbi:MAG: IS1595 family transposase [Rhodospirillaceae bacterium]
MTPTALNHPIYTDEKAACEHLANIRWPSVITCPRCGVEGQARALGGESMGPGWFYCGACQDKFTVRTGTVYERSHIPLHKWLLGFRLMASSKKGISAHQLHRTLGITYKSAWFMAHRIREAMSDTDPSPLGGKDKTVEVDETFRGEPNYVFVSGKGWRKKSGTSSKTKVLTLVERNGKARSMVIAEVKAKEIAPLVERHVAKETTLMTDEGKWYTNVGKKFAAHETVHHSRKEYARGKTHTNTVEGFFSIFKRGMVGTYQHCGEQHLKRYLQEFDFRYSNRAALGVDDAERTERAVKGAEGKRLMYRRPRVSAA